jgi:hypothetical protein
MQDLQSWLSYSAVECLRRINKAWHTYPHSLHAWRNRAMHRRDARDSHMYLGKLPTSTDCTYERLGSDNQRSLALPTSEGRITCRYKYGSCRSLLAEDDGPKRNWKRRPLFHRFSSAMVWCPPSCERPDRRSLCLRNPAGKPPR